METKVQFRVSEKDQILHDLVTSLQKQEKLIGARGYASTKIRDMIKAYKLISDHFEESDPYRLMMKIASNQKAADTAEEVFEEEERNGVDSNNYLKQFDTFANM